MSRLWPGPWSLREGARDWFTAVMFFRAAMRLGVGLAAARPALARLAASSLLFSVCEAAHADGMTALAASGPPDPGRGISGLAVVHARDQAGHGGAAGLALRWEAIGPDGELFPALDADLTLSPDGDHAVVLTLPRGVPAAARLGQRARPGIMGARRGYGGAGVPGPGG